MTSLSRRGPGNGDDTQNNPPFEFYPSYCFPASPTYSTWAKLTAADVHRLTTLPEFAPQGIYFHLNNPIRYICLTGVIVALDEISPPPEKTHLPTRQICHVDDSSGAGIEVVWTSGAVPEITGVIEETKRDTGASSKEVISRSANLGEVSLRESESRERVSLSRGLDIGTVVRVKGTIATFRGTKQVVAKKVAVLRDTTAEIGAWKAETEWRMGMLGVGAWVLTEEERSLWEKVAKGELVEDREDEEERRERRARRERKQKRRREKELSKEKKATKVEDSGNANVPAFEMIEADKKRRKKKLDRTATQYGDSKGDEKRQKARRVGQLDALGL